MKAKQKVHRRTYMRKEDRRKMVAKTAKALFASKGFHNTTMEDIADACGIAHCTLYLHFKNKEEIFHVLMLEALDRIQNLMESIRPDDPGVGTSSKDAFFNFAKEKNQRLLEEVKENRDLFRIILREAPSLGPEIEDILRRITNVMLRQVETELIIEGRLGLHNRSDVKLAAKMCLGLMLVVIVSDLIEGDPPDMESLAERVTEVQQFGIHGRPRD